MEGEDFEAGVEAGVVLVEEGDLDVYEEAQALGEGDEGAVSVGDGLEKVFKAEGGFGGG